jgi:hypothetical protein
MTLIKIAMVGVAIAAMMFLARDQRWFERAGVVGRCYTMPAPIGQAEDFWYACNQGVLSGFPNLKADSCSRERTVAHREIWRCDAPLTSLPGV